MDVDTALPREARWPPAARDPTRPGTTWCAARAWFTRAPNCWSISGTRPISTTSRWPRARCARPSKPCNATLLHIHLHPFSGNGGVSGVAVLAESHISIHTWPEIGYAAFDVFMCGQCDPHAAIPVLRRWFRPGRETVTVQRRGRPRMSGDWFTERLYKDYQQRLRVAKILHREKTGHQDLMIFEKPLFRTGSGARRNRPDHRGR